MTETQRAAMQQALDFILATNGRSTFWRVPGSNLNKTVTALRAALAEPEQNCECHRCIREHKQTFMGLPLSLTKMILCPTCGNKRCPHASDHRLDCTGSNEPGQPGSVYVYAVPAEPEPEPEPTHDLPPMPDPVAWQVIDRLWKERNAPLFAEWQMRSYARVAVDRAAPPARRPLTHPQIHELDWPDDVAFEDILEFARAIERAHGIGGNDE